MQTKNMIDNEFFILDSNNLQNTKTKLYGYLINDDVLFNEDIDNNSIIGENGAYIFVKKYSETITICQDFNGSYNLYFFELDEYFAISNSFLKLEEYLKEKYELSFNENYAKSLLSTISSSFAYDETLINEIKLIPKDTKININLKNNEIDFERINENQIILNSVEALNNLDNWYTQWIKIFRNLKIKTNNISIDLDGSLTSIIQLSLLLNSNINLDKIIFNTKNSYNNYENNSITTKLIETFSIETNTLLNINKKDYDDIKTPIDNSFYTKLGISKEVNFETSYFEEPFYLITNDEKTYDSYKNELLENYIESEVNKSEKYSANYKDIVQKYLFDNINKVQKHHKIYDFNSIELTHKFFQDTKNRNHMGKNCVESYLANKILLNPLNDSIFNQIMVENGQDSKLLKYLIILRYSEDLIDLLKVSSDFDEDIVKLAQEINNLKKYESQSLEFIDDPQTDETNSVSVQFNEKSHELNNFIEKIFFSNAFKHTFIKYFSNGIYDYILNTYVETQNSYLGDVIAAISIIKILEDMDYIQNRLSHTEYDWLKKFIVNKNYEITSQKPINPLLVKYNTVRIDIKNSGSLTNNIRIEGSSDENIKITNPTWFTNDKGIGSCIISDNSEISLIFKCINDGDLNIELRTIDIKDRKGRRFPIYVDILSFKVDDKEQLKENVLVHHDKPIRFTKKVVDSEIIKIDLKWQPFTNLSNFID